MSTDSNPALAGFGPNEWLVEEMYQKFLQDPSSVDAAWHEFFADYQPKSSAAEPAAPATTANNAPAPASARATAPAPAPAPAPTAAPKPAKAPARQARKPAPAAAAPAPTAQPTAQPAAEPAAAANGGGRHAADGPQTTTLRGPAARVVTNMEASLGVPTATSVRAVPAKLMIDNRIVINNHLRRSRGGKVSFTHLIGFAMVKALREHPEMNNAFVEVDGKPALLVPDHVNLGLAIDQKKPDGTRQLLVPSIKHAENLDFRQFWQSYEEIVRRARNNKLTADDFAGTTISLTNPGGIGTVHSVPRLMKGQGTIIGVGAMEYPAEFAGMSEEALSANAVSKVMTVTSTYDHRIIQGAQSGEFLKRIHELLLGADDFYDEVFSSLRLPYEPVRWTQDVAVIHEGQLSKESRVHELIHSYRVRGHLMADTDPLHYRQRRHPDLDILVHGLTLWDLDREFAVDGFAGERVMKLRDILGVLRDSYCRRIGIEYMHIQDPEQRKWIQDRVERPYQPLDKEEQKHILGRLNVAEAFETFLQTKYVGQRRFSLEGGESLIPALDEVITQAARNGLDEVVIGMAHRGRLNVLANIVGKSYGQIFREFEGHIDPKSVHGSGDVKYHLGADGTFKTADGGHEIAVSVACNPSHLEAVDPVLEGVARAKQDILDKGQEGFTVLPFAVHGDAAFAGQGVVAETLNLSQLRGYRTGGTIHLIVNNQVGFTTDPSASRSSVYATDVARMIQAPIFHVNGDDPEAVVRVCRLAFEFRQAFRKDVVVDMLCYRRRGHNEGDDPSMTQPKMYDTIDGKRSVRKLYTEALIGRGEIGVEDAEEALKDFQEQLERAFGETKDADTSGSALPLPPPVDEDKEIRTAIPVEVVKRIADAQVSWPQGFTVHPRVKPVLERRTAMASEGGVDWAFAELLAFGSLLLDGRPVRLAGQDSRRGTFVQRHSVLIDRVTGEEYTPLAHLDTNQAKFWVYDSLLSEFAAMGFEYGYSVANPAALVLWEAQFGDFVNGAQSVIDEFISSGEVKWGQRSSVTLLLPHGYEGQGPDHSSARLERFLQVCADENMTVAYPSSPANYFHLLRRQALTDLRKPMVVMTPKSMLRLKAATSAVEEFTEGAFQPVMGDPGYDGATPDPKDVRRVLLCAGKVCYDLAKARAKRNRQDVAIVRVEQLYPLPAEEILAALDQYPNATEHIWVQEEPANQGSWSYIALNLGEHLPPSIRLRRASRKAAAAPAVGSHVMHEAEQQALLDAALG